MSETFAALQAALNATDTLFAEWAVYSHEDCPFENYGETGDAVVYSVTKERFIEGRYFVINIFPPFVVKQPELFVKLATEWASDHVETFIEEGILVRIAPRGAKGERG